MLDSGVYLNGAEVEAFEREYAAYCGMDHCVACASGTDALTLMGEASTEVAFKIQANTCLWTERGLLHAGHVHIVDCDRDGRCPNYETDGDGILVPVLLYGAWDSSWVEPTARYIDGCQAHGYKPKHWQTVAFSFYPTKALGGPGDGGCLVTNQISVMSLAREYGHRMHSRMSELTAAILRVKLKRLDDWNAERNRLATIYRNYLPQHVTPGVYYEWTSNYHLFPVLVENRDSVVAKMAEHGVETKVHYDEPLGDFVNANWWCERVLSLPLWIGMTETDVRTVCDVLGDSL